MQYILNLRKCLNVNTVCIYLKLTVWLFCDTLYVQASKDSLTSKL